MNQQDQKAQREFEEFLSEMNDLIHTGILRYPADFSLWLEEVEGECQYCYEELRKFVDGFIRTSPDLKERLG